jgi:hypothetical protein
VVAAERVRGLRGGDDGIQRGELPCTLPALCPAHLRRDAPLQTRLATVTGWRVARRVAG